MNCRGFRRKLLWSNFKVLSQRLPGVTEGTKELTARIVGLWNDI
jgi:hypothetical protein